MFIKKIRVAIFADDVGRKAKGTAIAVEHLIDEYISKYKDQLDLVLICNSDRKKYLEKFSARIILMKNIPIPRFSGFFSHLFFFISVKEKFDIVHFPRPVLHPLFWFLKVLDKTKKIIVTFHGAPENSDIPIYQTFVSRWSRWFIVFWGKYFIDAVVVDSHFAVGQVTSYYHINKKKIFSIYLAADTLFRPFQKTEDSQALEAFKNNYHICSPYILSVARLDPHKNVHRLIEAFIQLRRTATLPQHLVLLSGRHEPKYSELVFRLVRESPYASDIHFLGFIKTEDMRLLYIGADVFAYVSLSEGFGLPLLEAMASGVPIVTSNISCMPEIAGDAALTVNPWDCSSIARGIKKVLDDSALRNSLKAKGFKRAVQFSWQSTALQYVKLYENCLYH